MAENERFMSGSLWLRSLGEFKRLNVVVFCGMMCALAMVLNMVASINVGPYIRIGFSGLPNQVVAYLFGPAVGGIFGAALDVIKYLIKPDGAFFPGFTVSAALGGIIYGAFLYKKKVTLARVFASQLLVKVVVNILLNTLWLNMLYGKAFLAILPGRVVSNAVMLPIDTAIMYFMLQAVDRTIKRYFDEKQISARIMNDAIGTVLIASITGPNSSLTRLYFAESAARITPAATASKNPTAILPNEPSTENQKFPVIASSANLLTALIGDTRKISLFRRRAATSQTMSHTATAHNFMPRPSFIPILYFKKQQKDDSACKFSNRTVPIRTGCSISCSLQSV